MKLTPRRNITRFTYEFTSFQGWRVAICRQHQYFIRYFSDRQYGGEAAALAAALAVRDLILQELSHCPDDPTAVFEHGRSAEPPALYPTGLAPRKSQSYHLTQPNEGSSAVSG